MSKTLNARKWLGIVLIGLFGQFAWTIETMYFNVFLYNTISTDPGYIASMVAWSATVATLTTLLMGALSDRLGRRKAFIALGYVLWGVSTGLFGFITPENAARLFPGANAAAAAAILVVVLDCVMTFFGSTANDAAFNAYITDVTDQSNRGRVESVLAILPLIAMLVIFGLFDGLTQQGRWKEFFGIFGIAVSVVGLLSLGLLRDDEGLKPRKDSTFKNLLYGLRPGVVKESPELYLSFAAFCLFSIGVQVFFPYLIIYIQNYLGITDYALILGVVLILASVISVVSGRFIDSLGKLVFVFPAALIMLLGLLGMYFVRKPAGVMVAGTVMMGGYMMVSAALSANIRDWTPEGKVGHFQGIRMIFAVMLPMIIGPAIGAAVIRGSNSTYVELGQVKTVPTPGIYLAAGAVLLLSVLPILLLRRREKQLPRQAEIAGHFPIEGKAVKVSQIKSGHINQTFLITTDTGSRYILQWINQYVFPNVDALMNNMAAISAFLRQREDGKMAMISYIDTKDGQTYYDDGQGGAWRIYRFVDNSICLQRAETAEDFYQSARGFGGFQYALRDFPAEQLEETIVDFHNTVDRYQKFRDAIEADVCGRLKEVEAEVDFALAREERACRLHHKRERGELPVRATHNDTKINNVLLDKDSRETICVIDLDTVMPGLSAYDFGDAIRFGASTAAEDETDLDKVSLNLKYFQAFTRGFLEACPSLTEAEVKALAQGAYTMTIECGIRFLTDYLMGDKYFSIDREKHNLDRCRTQFKLVRDMEQKWEQMEAIVQEEYEKLKAKC
ncbi:MAG: MFS transporter [Candidatus Limivicinus sp.]|nr:MFS transporter [Candidatus Limivicinus sp.]